MLSISLLFFLLTGTITEKSASVLPYGCQTEFTNTYGYTNFHPIGELSNYINNSMIIRFSVRAASDAHILLSPTTSLTYSTPVYEIVLGAGQNSFSVIRGKQRRRTMNHTATPYILSVTEERAFWIHLKGSLIEVGKGIDEDTIIYARDVVPLNVQYVCFSTWYQVIGKWTYSCPSNTESEKEEKQFTTSENLRKDILAYYDPYTRPVLSEDQNTTIYTDMQFVHVNLDEKNSIFTVNGVMRMKWKDEKIKWNPIPYGNASSMYFTNREIWQPDIFLVNAVGHGSGLFGDTPVLAKSDGSVYWASPVHLEAWCSSNLNDWPRDQHTCELMLSFASQQQFLQMEIDESANGDIKNTGSEWDIISLEADKGMSVTPGQSNPLPGITLYITIKRNNVSYSTLFVGPLIACILMTLLSFWLPAADQSKLFCSCCGMVVLSNFILEFGNLVPTPAYNVPPILFAYCSGLIALAVSICVSVIVISLTRYKFTCVLPRKVCDILSNKYLHAILLLPPMKSTENYSYAHLHEETSTNKETPSSEMKTIDDTQQYLNVLAIVIDRIACFTYAIYLGILLATYN